MLYKNKKIDDHKTLYEVNVLCTSQSQAKKIAENWKNNSSKYYNEIINILEN